MLIKMPIPSVLGPHLLVLKAKLIKVFKKTRGNVWGSCEDEDSHPSICFHHWIRNRRCDDCKTRL